MRRRILPFRKRSWRSKGSKVVLMSIIKMILKNPSCIVDPCVALACDTATSECSSISDTEAVCSCLSGFSAVIGETNVCEDVDECSEGTHNCPTVTTACVNNDGSFECGKPILWLFYTFYLYLYKILFINFIILNSLYIETLCDLSILTNHHSKHCSYINSDLYIFFIHCKKYTFTQNNFRLIYRLFIRHMVFLFTRARGCRCVEWVSHR
jgi:hypothetical protein